MPKRNIGNALNVYPMPVVMIGAVTDGRPNFMTAAWIAKVERTPPLIGVSLARRHHTVKGIRQTGEFSVNFPSREQGVLADYCGLYSGRDEDKAAHVEVFLGELESAPMVGQCPLTMECRVYQTVEVPEHFLFLGEVVSIYADETVLTDDQVDPLRLQPIVLTMPDNTYWALGDVVGRAWQIGKALHKGSEG